MRALQRAGGWWKTGAGAGTNGAWEPQVRCRNEGPPFDWSKGSEPGWNRECACIRPWALIHEYAAPGVFFWRCDHAWRYNDGSN